MSFKKSKIKHSSSLITNTVGIISLLLIFMFGLFLLKNTSFFKFQIEKLTNTEKNNEETIKDIKKEEDSNKINILVVGRGGGTHEAPNLTDTIILASINTKTKVLSMLSIPRDFYVEYNKNKKTKLNQLYVSNLLKLKDKNKAMKALEKKISEITGEKIDFFVNIDFSGFKDIIDTIGGIQITIPKNFVDNKYPDSNWGYKTLIFKKGTWNFDGDNALKYARSRHSTSDFDRSMRQQQVIKAIKDKLTGSYFLTSPHKIKELYDIFIKKVHTNLNLYTLIKLAYIFNSSSDFNMISSNLNDSCFYGSISCSKGGFLYTPDRKLFGGQAVLLSEGTNIKNLSDYDKLHKFTDIVFNQNELFKENYKINIFNSLKVNFLASTLSNDIIKYGFNIPKKNSIGNTDKIYKESIIYYNNINSNSTTLKLLKKFFKGKIVKTDSPKYSKYNAKIEIIIGKDYLKKDNNFNF